MALLIMKPHPSSMEQTVSNDNGTGPTWGGGVHNWRRMCAFHCPIEVDMECLK